ncbi:MAG: DUF721 domain-containing protein [Bacteroidales bacterium]|nr:DUF721 domain-containing protein [Bacteroidales bacterium]
MSLKSNEIKLGAAIKELLEAYKLSGRLNETRVIGAWEGIVGSMIAKHTTNIYIKRRKLYVVLDSPAIRNELSYARTKIVQMLNDSAGEQVIDEIVLL